MGTLQTVYELKSLIRALGRQADIARRNHEESRTHQRHAYVMRGRAEYVRSVRGNRGNHKPFWVYAKDLSRSGISFLRRYRMYNGEVIRVHFSTETGKTIGMNVKVVRCRPLGHPLFEIGGQFVADAEGKLGVNEKMVI